MPKRSIAVTPSKKGRHRRIAHRSVVTRQKRGRFASVWPCAQETSGMGTGVLAGWLHNAVIKIVTTYSMPGHRVLLLAPNPSSRRAGPYAGLFEAAWPVARLGRGIHTGLAAPDTNLDDHVRPIDLFNLVIVAAEPRAIAPIQPTSWCHSLAPDGILAVITHGQRTPSRFVDPADSLIRTGREDGLRYIDRIALLQVPISDDTAEATTPVVHARAHSDLHVFSLERGRE